MAMPDMTGIMASARILEDRSAVRGLAGNLAPFSGEQSVAHCRSAGAGLAEPTGGRVIELVFDRNAQRAGKQRDAVPSVAFQRCASFRASRARAMSLIYPNANIGERIIAIEIVREWAEHGARFPASPVPELRLRIPATRI